VRVLTDEIGGPCFDVREVAAATAGDAHFLGWLLGMIEHEHTSASRARACATEQARSACAQYDGVKPVSQDENSLKSPIPALLAA
jgi:hypothetical protein